MQLLHGVYNLQSKHERGEWTKIWKADALKIVKETGSVRELPCPILTRWWTVGVCVHFLLKIWNLVYAITKGVIKQDNTDKAANQIASASQALMATSQIKSDVYLIAAFHE